MADDTKSDTKPIAGHPGLTAGNRNRMSMTERRELTKAIAAWWYQNPRTRIPQTIGELAHELGKSPNTLRRLARNLPETLAEYIKQIEVHSLASYIETLENMAQTSASKSKDAVQAARFMRDIAMEHSKRQPVKPIEMPKHVTEIFQKIQEAKQRDRQARLAAENTADKREISSTLPTKPN